MFFNPGQDPEQTGDSSAMHLTLTGTMHDTMKSTTLAIKR